MGLLDRVSTLIRANINDLISRAEDPEKVINQLVLDMNNQLIQVKTQVAAAIAAQKQLEKRWQDNQAKADDYAHKAEIAVERGDDELAKEALTRKRTYQETADGFKQQWTEQSVQVDQLKEALGQLEAKIEEARTRKDLLIARSKRAKADTTIRKTMAGMDTGNALSEFERMEQKVEEQEATAKAYADLDQDTLDTRFRHMEEEDAVNKELEALKAKKSGSSPGSSGG
jgi:phage shock protein A